MQSRLENSIEQRVIEWARDNDVLHLKLNTLGRTGWPDRLFITPDGGIIWVEFKRPGEEPRGLQDYVHRQLLKHKQIVYVGTDSSVTINFLQACMDAARLSETGGRDDAQPSLCGTVPGSRFGEDCNRLVSIQAVEAARVLQANAGHSPAQADLFGVAGGDKEVE